ncbi:MAG: hypothetical protein ACRD3C_17530 [Vicinamibacterales bacterium]
MPRTTEVLVREVISTSLTSSQVLAFIADASLFVTEEVASEDPSLSAGRLELIERYLACALIRLRDLGLSSVSWSKVSENYQVDPTVTDYLKRAAAFDPTGKVRQMFMPSEGGFVVKFRVGETYHEDADDPPNTDNDP